MINSQYVKFGSATGLICALMLTVTAAVSQTPVLAQITPASEKFGTDESSTDSSPSTDNNGNEDASPDSSSSDDSDTAADDSDEDSTSSDDGESADTSDSNNDSGLDTSEQDSDGSNSLMESIMNRVNKELSAVGIATPGF